jgi:diadenosine tetraphosphate (Ap4A) HIT family hydrolase
LGGFHDEIRGVTVSTAATHCDESGVCVVADAVREDPGSVDRIFDNSTYWATIVDIAPIVPGHFLTIPYSHHPRSTRLGRHKFVEYGAYVDRMIGELARIGFDSAIAVEHGSPDDRPSMSCVRHSHMHLCPIINPGTAELVASLEEHVDAIVVVAGWHQAYDHLADLDEYMLIRNGDRHIVGRPRPGIRQISRALLASLNMKADMECDWVLNAENEHFAATMAELELARSRKM